MEGGECVEDQVVLQLGGRRHALVQQLRPEPCRPLRHVLLLHGVLGLVHDVLLVYVHVLDVHRLHRLVHVYHRLPIQLHVHLDVTHCRALLVDDVLDLVVTGVELEELDGAGLLGLPLEELSHELDLLVLSGQLDLVRFQDGRLLLHLHHQLAHALLQDLGDLCLDVLCVLADEPQLLEDEVDLVMNQRLLVIQRHIVVLRLV